MTKPSEPPFALIAKQLDEGIEQAQACAALSLLISNAKDLNKLDTFCPKLIELLDHEDAAVQSNAIAALAAGIEASDSFSSECIAACLPAKLMQLTAPATLPSSSRVALNALGALGAMGEAQPEFGAIIDSGGIQGVLDVIKVPSNPLPLLEAAVDTLCKLMSCGEQAKTAAVAAGAVLILASVVFDDINRVEITVRALLGLGMLVGGHDDAAVALASDPGAVRMILALMRQENDADCQHIAAGLFRELGRCAAAKPALLKAVKATQHSNNGVAEG